MKFDRFRITLCHQKGRLRSWFSVSSQKPECHTGRPFLVSSPCSFLKHHENRVESRCGAVRVGGAYPFPSLSLDGASIAPPCFVSTSRSSNRTGRFPASGSRTRSFAFAHGRLRVRFSSRTSPSES